MRAVVCSDSLLRREGLARILGESHIDPVALVGHSEALLREVLTHKPDLAIVDLRSEGEDSCAGLAAADAVRGEAPEVAVFVLTDRPSSVQLSELLAKGSAGLGCLLTSQIADLSRFLDDVRRVAEGGSAIDPAFLVAAGRPPVQNPIDRLSRREREALSLLATGHSNAAIAEVMSITKKSAEQHVGRIYDKLDLDRADGVQQRVSAALLFRDHGSE